MNTSNKLTLSRFVLAFMMAFFLTLPIPFGKTLALGTFIVAALTDYWDGRLARSTNRVTAFGQLMDPLADKVLVCAAFVSFVAMNQIVPAWIVITIITREFMVTGLRLLALMRGRVIPAGGWGKHKTIWQIVVIIVILLGAAVREDWLARLPSELALSTFLDAEFERWFGYLTLASSVLVAALTVISGTIYFWRCRDWVMHDA